MIPPSEYAKLTEEEKKYQDLLADFEFVKDLNTQMSMRYQEMLECFPTAKEVENIIHEYERQRAYLTKEDDEHAADRITKLKKFRSALVVLESQDQLKKPVQYNYEELNG